MSRVHGVGRASPYVLDSPGPEWVHQAACRGNPVPNMWFPAKDRPADEEWAKAICRRCPVVSDCLAWALETDQDTGVWGGMGEGERRRLALTVSDPSSRWPSCPAGVHEMTPETTTPKGECRPCRGLSDLKYRKRPDAPRHECPVCGRDIAARRGERRLAIHKNYDTGLYCVGGGSYVNTEVEQ